MEPNMGNALQRISGSRDDCSQRIVAVLALFPGRGLELLSQHPDLGIFWSLSYCRSSAGGAPLGVIKCYIQSQDSGA